MTMSINDIVNLVNRRTIEADYLSKEEMLPFLDLVIDDINSELQANFPPFTDYDYFVLSWNNKHPDNPLSPNDYSVIPARYIRSVIPFGVARYYYMKDQEGEQAASDYFREYSIRLTKMVRDFHALVPVEFQNNEGGSIKASFENEHGVPGLTPRGMVLNGDDFRI